MGATKTNIVICWSRKFVGSRDLALSSVQLLKKIIGQVKWQNARYVCYFFLRLTFALF